MSKYKVQRTTSYKKGYKKLIKSGRFTHKDDELLTDLIFRYLAEGKSLERKYHDHSLQGYGQKNMREFHFKPDLLVRYEIVEDVLVLYLEEIANHGSMF